MVAPTAVSYNNIHSIPGQGLAAAEGYFHAIGAETLAHGVPLQLGWFPPVVVVLIVIGTGLGRGRALDVYRFTGLVLVFVAVPFLLDRSEEHTSELKPLMRITVAVSLLI